jgi:DNA (cytosine-5)-methyltransferase 1
MTLLSLFAGAGGMDFGFHQAGFKTIWANEFDKNISPSYRNYFPKVKFDGRSIVDIPNEDLPTNITGVIGGPPCQSWSAAGARRGIDDKRGKLFFEYLRVIEHTKPLFFVAENVSGILHKKHSQAFEDIIHSFESLDYSVTWKLVNAADYEVPQDRKRVIIVGYHKSLNKSFVFPKPILLKKSMKDVIFDLQNQSFGVNNHEFKEGGFSSIFLSRQRVRDWNDQSFTILATAKHIPFHPSSPKMIKISTDIWKLEQNKENDYRRLTVRECARIQTFPDDYKFLYSNIDYGYKMIGNAVPVKLAYHIAKTIKNDL